jgi:hypothetical protein
MVAISPDEHEKLKESIGTHARERPLSPIQAADVISRISEASSIRQIAQEIGLSDTTILKQLVSLRSLPQEVQDLIVWGSKPGCVSFSVAAEIARIKDRSIVARLSKMALTERLSKSRIREMIRDFRQRGELPGKAEQA